MSSFLVEMKTEEGILDGGHMGPGRLLWCPFQNLKNEPLGDLTGVICLHVF